EGRPPAPSHRAPAKKIKKPTYFSVFVFFWGFCRPGGKAVKNPAHQHPQRFLIFTKSPAAHHTKM
ncbi:hypothetical protein, partial [Enterobacter intestinihominis]